FPSDGARMADYILATPGGTSTATLASGLVCEGSYSQMVRFSTRAEAEAVPLSELASMVLQAGGGRVAGLVVLAETPGLCGGKVRRSPADGGSPPRVRGASGTGLAQLRTRAHARHDHHPHRGRGRQQRQRAVGRACSS